MKRIALALCLLTTLSTPVWAADAAPTPEFRVISAPITDAQVISAPLARLDVLPSSVTVNGKTVTFDQGPLLQDGVLFVPVRAIAEAAGGVVTWDQQSQTVHVRMPDRTVTIQLGQEKAEMNEDGVYYFARNLIKMGQAPLLVAGRTLVSADALEAIFGLQVSGGADGALVLTTRQKPARFGSEKGMIAEVKAGAVLIAGAPMANGEASLTWATVTDDTKITVQEGGQTRQGTVADLTVNAQVSVTWAGPLMMSYPARGSAGEILVVK